MKTLFTLSLALMISFSGLSQKKQVKKTKSVKDNTPTEEVAVAMPVSTENEEISIDTIHITKGKPTLLLVQVNGSNQININDHREINELYSNFDKTKLDIINITRHSFIIFENNQTLDVSTIKNSYANKAFWSGKPKEQIQTEEGIKNSTEFFSKQLKVKKESSYIVNAKKHKKELAALIKKNMITDKSKAVMDLFLHYYSTPLSSDTGEIKIFDQNHDKIKNINIYISEKKGKKQLIRNFEFNELGQPATIKLFNEDGKSDGQINFEYGNGVLTKITEGNNPVMTVSYNNEKMIFSKKTEDAEITKLYWIENDELLEKEYSLANDDNSAYYNTIIEDKLENCCKVRLLNDEIIRKDCFTKKGETPFIYTYISYQDEDILQYYKVKLVKKTDTLYERFVSETNNPKEYKDNFKPSGSYLLNEKKQISVLKFIKDKTEKTIKIDYTYFP